MRRVASVLILLAIVQLVFEVTSPHPSVPVILLLLVAISSASFARLSGRARALDRRQRAREAVRDWHGYVADWHEQADSEDRRRRRQPPQER